MTRSPRVRRCMVLSFSMPGRITSQRDVRCEYRGVGGAGQPYNVQHSLGDQGTHAPQVTKTHYVARVVVTGAIAWAWFFKQIAGIKSSLRSRGGCGLPRGPSPAAAVCPRTAHRRGTGLSPLLWSLRLYPPMTPRLHLQQK